MMVKINEDESAIFSVNGVEVQVSATDGVLKITSITNRSRLYSHGGGTNNSLEIFAIGNGKTIRDLMEA